MGGKEFFKVVDDLAREPSFGTSPEVGQGRRKLIVAGLLSRRRPSSPRRKVPSEAECRGIARSRSEPNLGDGTRIFALRKR